MHRVDPKQIKQEIMAEIAEELSGVLPHTPGRPGDHIKVVTELDNAIALGISDEPLLILDNQIAGLVQLLRNEDHIPAVITLLTERASKVGVDISDE